MDLSPFAIDKIAPLIITGKSGRELVNLFNKYGFRDVYESDAGLPEIGNRFAQRPSKVQYARKRLSELSGKQELRDLLNEVVSDDQTIVATLAEIINPEGFGIEDLDGTFRIQGGVIIKAAPIRTEAHFQDIQQRILEALDNAQVSITVVMAWFTNEVLFQKLLEKHREGLDIKVAVFDDGINRKHGVDVSQLPYKLIRAQRGGFMHNKFCVIDNQVVITGSYNWSNNAEFKNDENITVEYNPEQATAYSVEYRRLQ